MSDLATSIKEDSMPIDTFYFLPVARVEFCFDNIADE